MTTIQTANRLVKKFGKEKAIDCIDEIIQSVKTVTGHCDLRPIDYEEVQKDISFWRDVKNSIQ